MGDANTPAGTDITPLAESHDEISDIFRNPTGEQEALLSVVGLQESEIRAYVAVVEHPDSKVDHIAEVVDRHRRYVSRSLRTLYEAGLVDRDRRTFETGGFGYIYSPIHPEAVKRHFRIKLQEWLADAQTEISKIDRRIDVENPLRCSHKEGN